MDLFPTFFGGTWHQTKPSKQNLTSSSISPRIRFGYNLQACKTNWSVKGMFKSNSTCTQDFSPLSQARFIIGIYTPHTFGDILITFSYNEWEWGEFNFESRERIELYAKDSRIISVWW